MGQSGIENDRFDEADHRLDVLCHELANVLNGLAGAAGMLRLSQRPAERDRWLDAIESSADQMVFLLRSCRPSGTESECFERWRTRRLNGIRLLERTVTAHVPVAGKRGARLLLSIDPRLPSYWLCAPGPLRQLLDNLVGNALKFSHGGDVVVAAKATIDGTLHLAVADNGPGVCDTDRERIFRPYRRGTKVGDTAGHGLGLHVCDRIARRLGGSIRCGSSDGNGATFTVDLPGVVDKLPDACEGREAFSALHCTLELDRRLTGTVGQMLDRFGVRWTRHADACREERSDRLAVLVSTPELAGHSPLLLQPRRGSPAVLSGVVLPSELEAALLRLVLQWRWARLRRRGSPD